ncbi:uncharacterized protein LOC116290709 [Actinia tenebrosa]|uniref:Uncharacterized protein LOC116290709 n=1 Tax=Actinia tenebrosa TaxID=6105 RepID=A0A6P8HDC3_ACTTE|nr:uncharacterized protein LOC116290709 [Actinia tenebrosa]
MSGFGRECACYGCSNAQYSKDGGTSGLSLFKFPQKNPQRDRWCNLIKRQHGRDGFSVNNLTLICEEHFRKEDIYRPPGGTQSRLREGAEPSIFPWKSSEVKPQRRVLVRQTNNPEPSVTTESLSVSTKTDVNLDEMEIEDAANVVTVSSENSNMHVVEPTVVGPIKPRYQKKAVQTEIESDSPETNSTQEHSYSFSFASKRDTFGEQEDYIKKIEDKLEKQTAIIHDLQSQVGVLKKQLEEYERKKFSIEKFKDDDSAILFYTGFPNYNALVAVYEYLEPKVGKLQYWNGQLAPDTKAY